MSYTDVPNSARSLEQRIRNLEGSEELAIRRRVGMALVVVGQVLPEGAIKGGSAMALRYGRGNGSVSALLAWCWLRRGGVEDQTRA